MEALLSEFCLPSPHPLAVLTQREFFLSLHPGGISITSPEKDGGTAEAAEIFHVQVEGT